MSTDFSSLSEGATFQESMERVTARIRRARLLVVSGPQQGLVLPLPEGGILLGSKAPADLVLDDASVSRRHAEIRRAPNGYVLRDLQSTNGTFVGDLGVGSVYLTDGTVFRIGHTEIAFEAREEGLSLDPKTAGDIPGMIAASPPMRELVAALRRFAPTDLSVVLEGETGVGKELAARALHDLSRRHRAPLVVVDCGALQQNLIESELFGHERGAFTGAVEARAGAFEEADGGTIFLDEVGELPLALQPKLLRTLEAREVRRLGSNKVRPVDVRVIAATNRDLPGEVGEKRFRADLFFRLSEVRLHVPPLRDRPEDIVPLAESIAREVEPRARILPDAVEALRARSWPGNVRELANVVRRAVVAAGGAAVAAEHLAPADLLPEKQEGPSVRIDLDLPISEARDAVVSEFNRLYLQGLLDRHGGDIQAVARHACVHEKSLYRLLRAAGVKPRS